MKSVLKDLLFKIEKAKRDLLPFVVYKKPDSKNILAFFQIGDDLHHQKDFSESGFVFAPFDNRDKTVIFPLSKCKVFSTLSEDLNSPYNSESFQAITENVIGRDHLNIKEKQNHISLVKKGIDLIKNGKVLKVVLSRKEEVIISDHKISEIFQRLLNKYSSAFVYLWFHPKVGLWMGASPETLLSVKGNKFKTMALAGTQSYKGTLDVFWAQKEKQEQQYVTDFIISRLNRKNLLIGKPFTLKAGSLLHICTEINGEISDKNKLKNLIQNLHPTPAVCGLPKNKAKEFILKNEDYKREYYTGFLGEFNMNKEDSNEEFKTTDLYVNLRCMRIEESKIALFVGGGITLDSDPLKEWEETIAKSEVMKTVL